MKIENWKYDHLVRQIQRTAFKPHESFIIGSLLHDEKLIDILPLTQFYVKRKDGKYALIDLYYPQLNLAIEIDEPAHNKNLQNDSIRQRAVEEYLNCNFFRISISKGEVLNQIQELKSKILELKKSKSDNWISWAQPERSSLLDLKSELKNTLFIKIRGFIKPEELEFRQTGFWKIANWRKSKIETVIIVHDGIITKVSNVVSWINENKRHGYSGTEIIDSNLIGRIVTDWNFQQTVTYSNDI